MPFEKPERMWLRLPKVGEEYDFSQHGEIKLIKKIESDTGFNFTENVPVLDAEGEQIIDQDGDPVFKKKDLGYHYDILFEDGKKVSISDWKSYYAFIEAEIQEGDKIFIDHPEKGTWKIKKV